MTIAVRFDAETGDYVLPGIGTLRITDDASLVVRGRRVGAVPDGGGLAFAFTDEDGQVAARFRGGTGVRRARILVTPDHAYDLVPSRNPLRLRWRLREGDTDLARISVPKRLDRGLDIDRLAAPTRLDDEPLVHGVAAFGLLARTLLPKFDGSNGGGG